MKTILIVFLLSGLHCCLFAQTHTEAFTACQNSYTTTCELQNTNVIKVSVTDGLDDSKTKEYTIVTNDLDVFAQKFLLAFKTVNSTCAEDDKVLTFARLLYFNFRASIAGDSSQPIAGLFTVKKYSFLQMDYWAKENGSLKSKMESGVSPKKYKIKKVTAEINDGYIENLKAYIEFPDGIHYFSVPYPIGITSIANFKKYKDAKLFDQNSNVFLKKPSKRVWQAKPDGTLWERFYVFLSDIIDYDYYLGVNRRDFSPANMTIDINGGESLMLHKDETHKLFEAHIFADFIGLKEDKPNGLLQTTLAKRINTNTRQRLSRSWFYRLFESYGAFQYVAPTITISKLEEHNKHLILGDLDSIRSNPGLTDTSKFNRSANRFTTGLQLYQHQSFSAGADVNLFYLNNHELKYNLYFNAGIRLGITPVRDSLTSLEGNNITKTGFIREYNINSFQFIPQVVLNFLPEERFNFSISEKLVYLKPLNQTLQVFSFDNDNISKFNPSRASWLNVFEMLMTIQLNQNGNSKLFGRVRLNSDWKNINNNFSQIQIGYSTFILGNK